MFIAFWIETAIPPGSDKLITSVPGCNYVVLKN